MKETLELKNVLRGSKMKFVFVVTMTIALKSHFKFGSVIGGSHGSWQDSRISIGGHEQAQGKKTQDPQVPPRCSC